MLAIRLACERELPKTFAGYSGKHFILTSAHSHFLNAIINIILLSHTKSHEEQDGANYF